MIAEKSFLKSEKETFVSLFKDYDSHCAPLCTLEVLSPVWGDKDFFHVNNDNSTLKNNIARSLYGSEIHFVQDHWDELYLQNGGENLICPICEIDDAEEMDHYIPREQMPEYSAHIHNLIPLCHKCNHSKGAQWLDNGSRIFFNAYFDKVPKGNLFIVDIVVVNKFPLVNITTNAKNNSAIIESTIEKLHLLKKYRRNLNKELRSLISETEGRYLPDSDLNEFLEKEYKGYERMIGKESIPYVRRLLYQTVLKSKEYKSWIALRLSEPQEK